MEDEPCTWVAPDRQTQELLDLWPCLTVFQKLTLYSTAFYEINRRVYIPYIAGLLAGIAEYFLLRFVLRLVLN